MLYFRFVFGHFSRLFERQADLHIFATNRPPQWMAEALDHIGRATGYSHNKPNWHHHSIQNRIDFIHQSIANPALVKQHHRLVRLNIICYFIILGLLIWTLGYTEQITLKQ
jgi:STE24 endopeptidase